MSDDEFGMVFVVVLFIVVIQPCMTSHIATTVCHFSAYYYNYYQSLALAYSNDTTCGISTFSYALACDYANAFTRAFAIFNSDSSSSSIGNGSSCRCYCLSSSSSHSIVGKVRFKQVVVVVVVVDGVVVVVVVVVVSFVLVIRYSLFVLL